MTGVSRNVSRDDAALEAFRKAVRDMLALGFDAGLLAEAIAAIRREKATMAEGQGTRAPRKDFADFAEPFCAGYIACRDGVSEDSQEEFIAALTEAWRSSGSERARRVVEAMQAANEPGERDAEHWG